MLSVDVVDCRPFQIFIAPRVDLIIYSTKEKRVSIQCGLGEQRALQRRRQLGNPTSRGLPGEEEVAAVRDQRRRVVVLKVRIIQVRVRVRKMVRCEGKIVQRRRRRRRVLHSQCETHCKSYFQGRTMLSLVYNFSLIALLGSAR